MHIHNVFCNRKSQTGPPCIDRTGLLHPVKFLKQQRKLFLRDHITEVGNRHRHDRIRGIHLYDDFLALRTVFNGIIDQVIKQTGQQIAVRRDHLGSYIALQLVGQVFLHKIRIKFL